jgi:predicted nuclease of restriction endonuclease-like (RecB) superfamily
MPDNYYNEIKHTLIKNNVTRAVKQYSINRSDLSTYYEVGGLLIAAGKHYGEGIIREYSFKLSNDLNKNYNVSSLKRMRQFYLMIEKGARVGHHLTWSHYRELIPIKDINKINYYIDLCESNPMSRDELKRRINSNEYERLPDRTKNQLITHEEPTAIDLVKDPIIIKHDPNKQIQSEEELHQTILEYLEDFLNELGDDFTFKASEYRITIGDRYNYIDLLLYNIKYRCYVVVELKVTELKAEHMGQIKKYMGYIDTHKKSIDDNKTVGIIICKRNNQYVIDYCSDPRITSREYILI